MLAEFSLIVIRGGAAIHSLQEMTKFGYSLLNLMSAIEVSAEDFDKSYDIIPRVIVQHSKEIRDLQNTIIKGEKKVINKVFGDKDFDQIDTGNKAISTLKGSTDPRFGILDIHSINSSSEIVANIAINTMTNIVTKSLLNIGITRRLNIGKNHDVITLLHDQRTNKAIEYYEINTAGRTIKSGRSVVGGESSALTDYKTDTGLDVGKILQEVDNNVDILDAPSILREIDELLAKISESVKFMKNGGFDTVSISRAEAEATEILNIRSRYMSLISQKSNMLSMYFKMTKPDEVRRLIQSHSSDKIFEIEQIKDVSDM